MIKQHWDEIEVSLKKIREFGVLIFIVVGVLIPGFILFKNEWSITLAVYVLIIFSTVFLISCLLIPNIMTHVYKSWMLLALALGFIMTRLIIAIVYFTMITPIGLTRRLIGSETPRSFREFTKKQSDSYWIIKDKVYVKEDSERQF